MGLVAPRRSLQQLGPLNMIPLRKARTGRNQIHALCLALAYSAKTMWENSATRMGQKKISDVYSRRMT